MIPPPQALSSANEKGRLSEAGSMSQRSFSITPIPPFRLDLTAWALRRRPENAIDRWDGMIYRRVLMIDSHAIEVAVHQSGGSEASQLNVDMTGARLTRRQDEFARTLLERMLGVHQDLAPFYKLATRDPRLQPLVDEFRGLNRLATLATQSPAIFPPLLFRHPMAPGATS
jgi:DNA-3-methyladenine glycosylase II